MGNWLRNLWGAIWAWCLDNDYVVLLPSAVLLLTLLGVAGLWYWFWLVLATAGLTLLFEFVAVEWTGLSISDQFRTWKEKHPVMAKLILVAFAFFATSLIFHLSLNLPL